MNQSCSDDCKEMKIADGMCLHCPKRKKHDDDNTNSVLGPALTSVALALATSAQASQVQPSEGKANEVQENTSVVPDVASSDVGSCDV